MPEPLEVTKAILLLAAAIAEIDAKFTRDGRPLYLKHLLDRLPERFRLKEES